MNAHIVNVDDRDDLESRIDRPNRAAAPGDERRSTRFLGLPGDNPLDPEHAPFAFYIKRPAGDVTPAHSHKSNRVEFVIDGKIEWRQHGKDPVVYGAGTLTYVEAGTVYGYEVLEDATILLLFEQRPHVSTYAAERGAF